MPEPIYVQPPNRSQKYEPQSGRLRSPAEATSRVFTIIEILEQILLHCVTTEDEETSSAGPAEVKHRRKTTLWGRDTGIIFLLKCACLVNKTWKATIKSSPQLQEAMFFAPNSTQVSFTLNPLLGRMIRDAASVQAKDKITPSWSNMLVAHTSHSRFSVRGYHYYGLGYHDTFDVSFARDVLLAVFATWISHSGFAMFSQELDGDEAPVVVLNRSNCMKRGKGEISYKVTPWTIGPW